MNTQGDHADQRGVIQLSKFYWPYNGGLEAVVKDIAEGVAVSRSCSVLAAWEGTSTKLECIEGVTVIRVSIWREFGSAYFSWGYIREVFRRVKGQLVHVHLPNPMSNLALMLAWALGKKPARMVVHWHSDIIRQKKSLLFYKPFQDWLLRKANAVIATSDAYLLDSRQLASFVDKCTVIPIGIDSLAGDVDCGKVDAIRAKYRDRRIVFCLGRHIYYKGFEYLIAAFCQIDNAVLLLGGVGPDTQKYVDLAKELGVAERVEFLGRVAECDLPSMYAAANCFCLPSIEKSEAFGVVQLEAMSVGTPVVSTDIDGSGVPWVNKHMCSGIVCSPKSADGLANGINLILDDPILRQKLSDGSLERFNRCFQAETMIAAVESLYERIGR